jgi:general stress protein CsbA
MNTWTIVLIVAAIIVGLLYMNVRSSRKKREGGAK